VTGTSANAEERSPFRIGVISDTHGKLAPEAMRALAGSDAIVHAGDIGSPDIYYELMAIAPVTAVLGNTDTQMPGLDLSLKSDVPLGGKRVLVVHDVTHSGYVSDATDIVISGHTHVPRITEFNGVLYVNPGSASRSRGHGHTVALIDIEPDGTVAAQIVDIDE